MKNVGVQMGVRFRTPPGVVERPAYIGDLSPMKYYNKKGEEYPITNILQSFELFLGEEGFITATRTYDDKVIAKRKTMLGINNALKRYAEKWQESIDKQEA